MSGQALGSTRNAGANRAEAGLSNRWPVALGGSPKVFPGKEAAVISAITKRANVRSPVPGQRPGTTGQRPVLPGAAADHFLFFTVSDTL
jgi:hypothetical protein